MGYKAVHQIESTVKGKRRITKPGQAFQPANGEEEKLLLSTGAIRKTNTGEKAAPAAEPEPELDPDYLELENMTKAQLISFADGNGIEVNKSASKADILAEIEAWGLGDELV